MPKEFYDRKKEIGYLMQIENQSKESACFTLMTGRRRIGKTQLLKEFIKNKKSAYLFVTRNTEAVICGEWQKELESSIGLKIYGQIEKFSDLFKEIMLFSQEKHFILVIDEFQDLQLVNSAVFSEMQNLWDRYKAESKINLIVCGSMYSLMTKIFEDAKEPLFGRATHRIHLKQFEVGVLKQILKDYSPSSSNEDLLCLYMLTGGVAKYVFLLMAAKAFKKEKMLDYATNPVSPFLIDGKDLLVSEMGRDYGIYFSIMRLIAEGKTSQSEIDSVVLKNTGSYLQNLWKVYGVIQPVKPILSDKKSRNTKWTITDCYLKFWFRFIYANQKFIELEQFDELRELVRRDYETFTGKTLEQYFIAKISDEEKISDIGGWWDRKSQIEIDIVKLDDAKKNCTLYEVKRNKTKINLEELKVKAKGFAERVGGMENYSIELKGLSMADM